MLISGFATGGLLLSQAAYRGGLAAPLAVVNLSNPAAAAVIGVVLLGETFRAGAWGWCAAAGASLIAARGVVLLTKGGSGGTGDTGAGGAAENGGAVGVGVVAGAGAVAGPVGRTGAGAGGLVAAGAVAGLAGRTGAGAAPEGNAGAGPPEAFPRPGSPDSPHRRSNRRASRSPGEDGRPLHHPPIRHLDDNWIHPLSST